MTPFDFHARLPGYAPTEVRELQPGRSNAVHRLFIKLETARYGLPAFKVLGASWAGAASVAGWLGRPHGRLDLDELRAEIGERASRPTLVTATDGNHGRAVAWTARQLGIPAEIFMPAGTAEARLSGVREEGAVVTVVDGDYDQAVTAAVAVAAASRDRLLVQDTAVPGERAVERIVEGYATIFDELDEQIGPIDRLVLVVPVGVGSLAVAAARHLARRHPDGRLVTVEPAEAASLKRSLQLGRLVSMPGPHTSCMVGLRCGTISDSAWPELRGAGALAVALEDDEADASMRWLAERGIDVGECGAAALAAFRQLETGGQLSELLDGGATTVVLIATEAPTDPERWQLLIGRPPAAG